MYLEEDLAAMAETLDKVNHDFLKEKFSWARISDYNATWENDEKQGFTTQIKTMTNDTIQIFKKLMLYELLNDQQPFIINQTCKSINSQVWNSSNKN